MFKINVFFFVIYMLDISKVSKDSLSKIDNLNIESKEKFGQLL